MALLSLWVANSSVWAGERPGKFTIVGMGTAPDLITLRGVEVIERGDVFVIEDAIEREIWKAFIKGRETWLCPHTARVLLGIDPKTVSDPKVRARAEANEKIRRQCAERIRDAVRQGKNVVSLQAGDPMMYGTTWYLELLPADVPTEIVPGIGAFEASTAAVKMSPSFGYDTNAVILTMADWPGRTDTNEQLMATQASMIFYTMHLDYPALFAQLARHYPADTPVAVVCDAGDPKDQRVLRSTVGRFLKEIEFAKLPNERHILLVGKFLTVGQARKEGCMNGQEFIELMHGGGGGCEPK